MTGDENTAPSNDADSTELEEEDLAPDESIASHDVFTTPSILTAYKNYHADLRTIIPPHLNVSSLLLTLSFGAMYFIIRDSKNIPIQIPECIPYLLFFIILALIASILLGIGSIYLRPIPTSLETGSLEELKYHSKIYETERRCSFWATVTLIAALALIVIGLIVFASQENSIGMTLDKTKVNNSSQNTVIYITSNNSFVDINGTDAYTISISRNGQKTSNESRTATL